MFLRDVTIKPPLTPPYTGPYQVLARSQKTFTIVYDGKEKIVSRDRVKPAFLDATYPKGDDISASLDQPGNLAYPPSSEQPQSNDILRMLQPQKRVTFAEPLSQEFCYDDSGSTRCGRKITTPSRYM